MSSQGDNCKTSIKQPGPGRPALPGKSWTASVRFREGKHDEIIKRLKQLPPRSMSDYIRRVLEGAPVEALDVALVETQETRDGFDSMFDSDFD